MCLPLKVFLLIVPLKVTRDSQRFWFLLWGVYFNSAVCITPQSLTLQYNALRRAWLCGGMHTAELDYMVWCTPWSLTQPCDAHLHNLESRLHTFRVWLSGKHYTAESDFFKNICFYVFEFVTSLNYDLLKKVTRFLNPIKSGIGI